MFLADPNEKTMHMRLKEKGWTLVEIEKTTRKINDQALQQKHIGIKEEMHKAIYWLVLFVLTIGNFFVSIILVPFMLVLEPAQIELIAVVLGIVVGALFSHLIWSIEHIEAVHHLVAAIFLPVVAVINVFIMAEISNSFASRLGLAGHENPYLVSVLYAAAFLVPYGYVHVKNWILARQS